MEKWNDALHDYRDERERAAYPDEWLARYEKELRDGIAGPIVEQADSDFAKAALRRIADDPWRFYLILPLIRTSWVWFYPSPADFTMDSLKGAVIVLGVNAVPLIMLLLLGLAAGYAAYRRSALPLLIVISMAMYTVLGV